MSCLDLSGCLGNKLWWREGGGGGGGGEREREKERERERERESRYRIYSNIKKITVILTFVYFFW